MIGINIEGKKYGDDAVLGQISLTIKDGETLALLGPSGIGKSTFLRIVAGLDQDFQGQIELPVKSAMVFQEPVLLPWRTALQNIMLVTGIDETRARSSLGDFGLASKADHYPMQLSMGQQRRLALARAFAAKPKFLIMDEPFASLDMSLAQEILVLTRELVTSTQTTTLFVTHAQREAEFLADRILHMDGCPAEIVDRN